MPRYRLTIAYDGSAFHGWQRQLLPEAAAREHGHDAPAGEDGRVELRTVQAELARAIEAVIREPVQVQGASRTDAGVHARHQTAAFTTTDERRGPPDERLAMAINAKLPPDALVLACERVDDDFEPISDCLAKGYRYAFHVGRTRPLWDRAYVAHTWEDLDAGPMREAASLLVGEHDFAAFASAGHGRESTVRTLIHAAVRETPVEAGCRRIEIDVAADGFLYNMVRIIAGTLHEVGRGRLTADDVRAALSGGDRRRAGPTYPPHGLRLEWALYPGDDPAPIAERFGVDPRALDRPRSDTGDAP
jgi:tRNA pseudouridine38-40 synthase